MGLICALGVEGVGGCIPRIGRAGVFGFALMGSLCVFVLLYLFVFLPLFSFIFHFISLLVIVIWGRGTTRLFVCILRLRDGCAMIALRACVCV